MPVCDFKDSDLVLLLNQNDETAFTEIYNRYWTLVYATANKILRNETVAEDIVQEVFLSIWKRSGKLQIQSLKPYLLQATRFQVFKAIRAGKADGDFYTRLTHISNEIRSDNPLLYKEVQRMVKQEIASLPEDQRTIFLMSRQQDLTYSKIAEMLGISVKTVEKKISQSLRTLRLRLRDVISSLLLIYINF